MFLPDELMLVGSSRSRNSHVLELSFGRTHIPGMQYVYWKHSFQTTGRQRVVYLPLVLMFP